MVNSSEKCTQHEKKYLWKCDFEFSDSVSLRPFRPYII